MIKCGAEKLKKIAVIGRGTAGSLAASCVTKFHPDKDHELHHIYDSNLPIIGVGEGGWPALVTQLHELTSLPYETIQVRLKATRKYGIQYEGWGRRNTDFTHYFSPQQLRYSYHLSADLVTELLQESTRAVHIDAQVTNISKLDGRAVIEFKDRETECYDLVFDARGFPKKLDEDKHYKIDFLPTNTAIVRRCPAIVKPEVDQPYLPPTYTRAIARPHGWVFVIPLVAHTSYGYIFNRNISDQAKVEEDFNKLLEADGVKHFEQRAVISFPSFIHRQIYDGTVAHVGNAASFMEPLEATSILAAQLQIGMILQMRLNRPVEYFEKDAKTVNRFLVNTMTEYGLFVGWHYSCGSKYNSDFWQYAQKTVWPRHVEQNNFNVIGSKSLEKFYNMFELLKQPVLAKEDLERSCGFPLSSFAQLSHGLGCYPPSNT